MYEKGIWFSFGFLKYSHVYVTVTGYFHLSNYRYLSKSGILILDSIIVLGGIPVLL